MKKLIIAAMLAAGLAGCQSGGTINLDTALQAGTDLGKAITLSDAEVIAMAKEASVYYDSKNKVAPASNAYAKRLVRITKGLANTDGLKLNFKVYLTKDVNAFAMADGTVRVYSGLLDNMTDDQVRFVIGHEIGHVKLGHSKKAMQVAYAASGARKAAATTSGAARVLSQSQMGDLAEKLLNAQFSQSQEQSSDDYSLKFMKAHKYNVNAAPAALRVLEKLYGNNKSVFSSHPGSGDRAARMEKMIAAGK